MTTYLGANLIYRDKEPGSAVFRTELGKHIFERGGFPRDRGVYPGLDILPDLTSSFDAWLDPWIDLIDAIITQNVAITHAGTDPARPNPDRPEYALTEEVGAVYRRVTHGVHGYGARAGEPRFRSSAILHSAPDYAPLNESQWDLLVNNGPPF